MATVYSLVCWGGRTGKTVTLTTASPCVITITDHGLRDGTRLVFSTTGALPTGITAGTTYYAKITAANTFNLYTDSNLTTIVNTSGSQSGTHTAKSRTMLDYFDQYAGRWGDSGSERCYDSLSSVLTTRGAEATRIDPEIVEYGEAFTEYATYGNTMRVGSCPYTLHTSRVNGARSGAFHNGNIGEGYINLISNYGHKTGPLTTVDGLQFEHLNSGAIGSLLSTEGSQSGSILNNICIGKSTTSGSTGIFFQGSMGNVQRNLVIGCTTGILHYASVGSGKVALNTASKNGTGIKSHNDALTYRSDSWVDNISIGNTINWGVQPTTLEFASNNVGESGDPIWTTTGGASITATTSDFADYTNNNYRPSNASSALVDAAIEFYGVTLRDISDAECPNYNNGGAEAFDVGCYEFDHGFGPHPATSTINLTNIVSGSRVLITRNDTNAVLYNDVPGASLSLSTGYIGAFTVIVRKASDSPYYREFQAGGTTVADQMTTIQSLQQLDE